MKRIMLRVAYDGTAYHGWQRQNNGNTIEGEINKAIKELTGEDCELIGGSRTDSGVHAKDNVCVFDTISSIPGEKFSYALNQRLPEDIRIMSSREVASDFHPRHCDSVKTYEYHIYNAEFPDPMKRLYSYFTYSKLDIEAMKKAAGFFKGEHDFSAFCAAGAQVDCFVRTVYSCEVICDIGDGSFCHTACDKKNRPQCHNLTIRVSGNGFLYNMVRIIAGTLLEVGRGTIKPDDITRIIESGDRSKAGPTAPACGLTLMEYRFS